MSEKKTRKHHKPHVKPCANYKPVSMITAVEERMNRIVKQLWEMTMDPRPLELARDVAAGVCAEVCKCRVFNDEQADEE